MRAIIEILSSVYFSISLTFLLMNLQPLGIRISVIYSSMENSDSVPGFLYDPLGMNLQPISTTKSTPRMAIIPPTGLKSSMPNGSG